MASKKPTKKELARQRKIDEMKEVLELIFSGACGRDMTTDEYAGFEDIERIVPAVCEVVLGMGLDKMATWAVRNLDKWCSPTSLAEHLVDDEDYIEFMRKREKEGA